MGYQTYYYGDLQIVPPVTVEERAEHPELDQVDGDSPFWPYWVSEDGTAITTPEDTTKASHHGLIGLVKVLLDSNPQRQILGYTYGDGESVGDHWRAWVDLGEVYTEDAKLIWPDGTEAQTD